MKLQFIGAKILIWYIETAEKNQVAIALLPWKSQTQAKKLSTSPQKLISMHANQQDFQIVLFYTNKISSTFPNGYGLIFSFSVK